MVSPEDPTRCFLALGSNKGHRFRSLLQAVEWLSGGDKTRVVAASSVYETEAHTISPQESAPPFLNAVVGITADCGPGELLEITQELERRAGRRPAGKRWAPRELDIDLLTFGLASLNGPRLKIPHPRLAERRFVLQPLAEVAPDLHLPHPFDETVTALLDSCPDTSPLFRTSLTLIKRT